MSDAYSDYMKQLREQIEERKKKTGEDGHQRAMANIKRLGKIQGLAKELLLFSEPDGSITQGFRTQDIVKELQEILGWHEWAENLKRKDLTLDDIEIGKEYYFKAIAGTKKIFFGRKVEATGKSDIMVQCTLLEQAGKYAAGTTISVWPGGLTDDKEEV